MAEMLEPQDIMFTPFEPKLKNRFIMNIDGIPAYLIKTANRPSLESDEVILEHMNVTRYVKGKTRWQPTGRDGYSDFYKKDVTFNLLGPVGDVVEEWKLKGCYIQSANFGDLDFATSDPAEISLTLKYDYAILQF